MDNCFSSHTHAMEYHSAMKKNEPSTQENTRVNLTCILLSERIMSEEDAHSMTLPGQPEDFKRETRRIPKG